MKLVMNPRGHVQDWHTLKNTGMYTDHGALSPEICFDLVKDLHSPTGKGNKFGRIDKDWIFCLAFDSRCTGVIRSCYHWRNRMEGTS